MSIRELARIAIFDLNSEVCRCGAKKQSAHSFCSRCYFSLPGTMRQALYHRLGNGYEQAYVDALHCLTAKGRITDPPEWLATVFTPDASFARTQTGSGSHEKAEKSAKS